MLARRKPAVERRRRDRRPEPGLRLELEQRAEHQPRLTPAESRAPRAVAGPVQLERGPDRTAATTVAGWVTGVAVIVLLIACANVTNLLLGARLASSP